jgi:membrane protein involved in colicin uptake
VCGCANRFQKAKEDKEQKRKEEEHAAAALYDGFVASFSTEEEDTKTFVRGRNSGGDVYKLEGSSSSSSQSSSAAQALPTSNIVRAAGRADKHRQIDDFLSELKSKQDNRTSGGSSSSRGSGRDGDRDRDRDRDWDRDRDRDRGSGRMGGFDQGKLHSMYSHTG